ncbi:MAG: hypothetical protein KBT58_02950 [Bizionia sp.]|nr:hypothetical protein [Bizionia sp.]
MDQGIVSGSNFLLSILLARVLNLDVFGEFSLLWLVLLFFLGIQNSFIISPMYSLEPKRLKNSSLSTSNLLVFQFGFVLVSLLLLFVFFKVAQLFSSEYVISSGLFSFALFFIVYLVQDFIRRFFFLKEKYNLIVIMDMLAYLGSLSLIFIYKENALDLNKVFTLMFFCFSTSIVFSVFFLGKIRINFRDVFLLIKEYWVFSKWLSFSAILQWFSGNIYVLVGSFILGPWVAGVVKIFQNIMGLFNVAFQAFENFIPISAAHIYKELGYKNMINYIKGFALKGFVIFFILGVLIVVLSPKQIISYIYGSDYLAYSNLIYIYICIYIFIYLGQLIRIIIRTIENTKVVFWVYFLAMIFSILLSWPLVKFYEITGIVIGTLLTQIFMFILYYKLGLGKT